MKKDPDLTALRSQPEFQELLKQLEKKGVLPRLRWLAVKCREVRPAKLPKNRDEESSSQ